ncbi:hypothetical protein LI328DRAFT_127228 [Trichoderma asperelloides]|nr:hypothetical protein LI328DRAFT_127228 [Trichoderma asperelloides]
MPTQSAPSGRMGRRRRASVHPTNDTRSSVDYIRLAVVFEIFIASLQCPSMLWIPTYCLSDALPLSRRRTHGKKFDMGYQQVRPGLRHGDAIIGVKWGSILASASFARQISTWLLAKLFRQIRCRPEAKFES